MYAKIVSCFCWILISLDFAIESETVNAQTKGTYSIQTDSRRVVGTPLAWDNERLFLLSGYGQFDEINLDDVRDYKKKSELRLVYTTNAFSNSLQDEFGRSYRVTKTNDFLVVHSKVQTEYWPSKIQNIHDVFKDYMEIRRIRLHKKIYPLVAVVFDSHAKLMAYARKHGEKIPSTAVGYYSMRSNRVLILDRSHTGRMTESNLRTVIHEIVHQSAFNCGVHRRFSETPSWVVEGLGTMFEAPGVYKPLEFRTREFRIHDNMKKRFSKVMEDQNWRGWIGPLVLGDRAYKRDSGRFYSSAWALSFFLMETHPYEFARYLQKLEDLPTFKSYSQEQRLRDFENTFGTVDRLEGSIRNFFARL